MTKEDPINIYNLSINQLRLSVRSTNCLVNAGIIRLGDLVKKKEEELLLLRNFGKTSLKEINRLLKRYGLTLGMTGSQELEGGSALVDPQKPFPLFYPDQISCHPELTTKLEDVEVKVLNLSKRAINVLEKLKIYNVSALLFTKKERIFTCKNCGKKTLSEIQEVVRLFLSRKENKQETPSFKEWISYIETEALLEENLKLIFAKSLDRKIFERRIGLYKKRETLEEIARSTSLTRERIRQITKKQVWNFFQSLSLPYKNFIYDFVNNLKQNTFVALEDNEIILNKAPIEIFNSILSRLDDKIYFDNGFRMWVRGKSNLLREPLDDFLQKECRRGLSYSEEEIGNLGKKFIQKKSKFSIYSDAVFNLIKSKYFKKEGTDFYFGGVTSKSICEKIIKEDFPNGFRINTDIERFVSIVQERGLESYVDKSKYKSNHTFVSFVTTNENIILWDWGVYIHIDNVKWDYAFLSAVIAWVEEKINSSGVGKISVWAAYVNFKEDCSRHNIPNEHALYSLLRLLFSERFFFRKDPYITLNKSRKISWKSRHELLERYLFNKGKPVSVDEIERDLGLKNYQVDQSREGNSNIIPWGDRGFRQWTHVGSIIIDNEVRKKIEARVVALVREKQHVCIAKIFREFSDECKNYDITTPYSLYFYLSKSMDKFVSFPRYPVLIRHDHDCEDDGRFSFNDILYDYFKKEQRPYSRSEVVEYFVEERGYGQRLIDNIQYFFSQISKYTNDSFVFLPTLSWDESKDKELLSIIRKIYQNNLLEGRPFVTILELKKAALPNINEKSSIFVWKDELLTSLIGRFDGVRFLSQSKESFMIEDAPSLNGTNNKIVLRPDSIDEESILESLIFQ